MDKVKHAAHIVDLAIKYPSVEWKTLEEHDAAVEAEKNKMPVPKQRKIALVGSRSVGILWSQSSILNTI